MLVVAQSICLTNSRTLFSQYR